MFFCKLLITVDNIKRFKNIFLKKIIVRMLLNIRIIVGLIHEPAYAKLVILETETLAKVCKGDRAAFAMRL